MWHEESENTDQRLPAHPSPEQTVRDPLDELLRQTTPSEPEDVVWRALLARIEQGVSAPPPRQRWRGPLLGGMAAAGLLLALLVGWRMLSQRTAPREPSPLAVSPHTETFEPLEVLSANEVVIISIDGADTPALVVGEPPVENTLVLADPGDVRVERVVPHADGARPDLHQAEHGTPMIVSPLLPPWSGN